MKIEECAGRVVSEDLDAVIEYSAPADAWSDDHPCYMDFRVLELGQQGDTWAGALVAQGNVKWDGCSNWRFADGYHHMCGLHGVRQFMNRIAACYHIAGKFMPESIGQ